MPFYTFPYPSICIKKGGTKEGTKMVSANKLTNAFIKTADVGKHLDGAGLFFRKRKTGSADWVLRFRLNGKRHEMGLGGYPNLSLKLAEEINDKSSLSISYCNIGGIYHNLKQLYKNSLIVSSDVPAFVFFNKIFKLCQVQIVCLCPISFLPP